LVPICPFLNWRALELGLTGRPLDLDTIPIWHFHLGQHATFL
jgi:hypothetical protein